MKTQGVLFLRLFDDAIHKRRFFLADDLVDGEDLNLDGAATEGNFDYIADLDVIGCAGGLATDRNTSAVAGFVGDGAALYKARNLEIFIQSHNISS